MDMRSEDFVDLEMLRHLADDEENEEPDEEEVERYFSEDKIAKADQFLSWFADGTGTADVDWNGLSEAQRRFLCDQCTSLARVCDDAVLASYVGSVGRERPEVFSYLRYLNDPERYDHLPPESGDDHLTIEAEWVAADETGF